MFQLFQYGHFEENLVLRIKAFDISMQFHFGLLDEFDHHFLLLVVLLVTQVDLSVSPPTSLSRDDILRIEGGLISR